MTTCAAVAQRINQLLKEKDMTQYRLEQCSGIQHGSMQCIMNGRNWTIQLNNVIAIAKGFGMSVSEFSNDPIFESNELEIE